MATPSAADVLAIVRERGCYVFGTGFVASMLVEALRSHNALGAVRGYLVSECDAPRSFEGVGVCAASDVAVDRGSIVLVAVHETSCAEAVRLLELQASEGEKVQRPDLQRSPVRPEERVLDRQPHVRRREMRHDGAVFIFHHGMNDALRLYDDLDL